MAALIRGCHQSPPTAAAAVVARGYLLTQMNHLNPAVVVEAGAASPCGESTLRCCIYYERSQKCPGWSLSQQPRGAGAAGGAAGVGECNRW